MLIKYIFHAKLTEIDNCGHWNVIEKPEEIKLIAEIFSIQLVKLNGAPLM